MTADHVVAEQLLHVEDGELRREVRQAVMSLVNNEVSTADNLSRPEWTAAIEIVDRLAKA